MDRVAPPIERARRYRELAESAYQQAAHSQDPDMKLSFVRLAGHWRKLALFAEQTDAATRAMEAEAPRSDESQQLMN